MIKLIATDVDGTLVKDSSPDIYPEIFDIIRALKAHGVLFCVASGRQYTSIEQMFHEVKDDIVYIADNGAHIKCRGVDINATKIREDYLTELVGELKEYKDIGIVCEAPGLSYIEEGNDELIHIVRDNYRARVQIVKDILKEGKDIIKVSTHDYPSIRTLGEEVMIPRWSDRLKATMAGDEWLDFMDKSVDKGNALKFVQERFGISLKETMTFGDNNNDMGMLERAEFSYAVESAPDVVKERAAYICPSWKEKGVYQVLLNYCKKNGYL